MRWRGLAAVAAIAVAGGWCAGRGFSDEAPKAGEGMPSAAEMERMMEQLATPGEMHAWLAKMDGAWDVRGKFTEADGKMTESSGHACLRMVMGGRFQEQILHSTMQGKPFTGYGLTGFDNGKQKFVNTWLDNWGTGFTPAEGTLSADKKVLTFGGTMVMGPLSMPFRYVLTVVDDAHLTFQMYGTVGDQESLMMDMAYVRSCRPCCCTCVSTPARR